MKIDEKKVKEKFGSHVRMLREKQGHTQEELAYLCDLDRSYIGGVERGERNMSLVNIIRLSNGLNINASALFDTFELSEQTGSDA
jgi:transcriptional regulator with XRE-family HTH domain